MSEFKSPESAKIVSSVTGETLFDFEAIEPPAPSARIMSEIPVTPYIPEARKSGVWDDTGSHDAFNPTNYEPPQLTEFRRVNPEKEKTAKQIKREETHANIARKLNLSGTASRTDEQNEGIASALDDSTRYTRENLVRSGLSPNHAAAIMIARALKKAKNR